MLIYMSGVEKNTGQARIHAYELGQGILMGRVTAYDPTYTAVFEQATRAGSVPLNAAIAVRQSMQ